MKDSKEYTYEVGPIRPPSEAASLLLRVTRNCPWNRCKFCGVYKKTKFSLRPKEHVIKDIDSVKMWTDLLKAAEGADAEERNGMISRFINELNEEQSRAYSTAVHWYRNGMKSIFLQDSDSLVIKPDDLVDILTHLKKQFPETERITSYARSETVARISDVDMKRIAEAGLNRIHIGMETGSDVILKLVDKGTTKAKQILAGQKVKAAGIELSEYFIPGLGGNEYSELNALETADALNQINPDFIRIRTLAVTERGSLMEDYKKGIFTRANDTKMVEELLLMIENLQGITSTIVSSDHIINLLPEAEGRLPEDKEKIISVLKGYLDLPESEKTIYRVGRRTGMMSFIQDLSHSHSRKHAQELINRYGISNDNVDAFVDDLMNQFI
ncbi:MAG: radical SAM protein [Anaerovoracaceae bacterium]|jgi:polyhydroxyalkanoate synthesis regulator phasin